MLSFIPIWTRVLSGVLLAAGIGILLWGNTFFSSGNTKEYHVVLTPDGFQPQELDIREGQRVGFTTTRSVPFWPASDLHPSHEIYRAFDPREPISPDGEWTFRFAKSGTWTYHDHLAPQFTGVIRVTAGKTADTEKHSANVSDCAGVEPKSQQRCWEESLVARAKKDGFSAAFALFAKQYDTDPLFRRQCHDYVHALGKTAHRFFAEGRDIAFAPEMRYCSFGFYHGFMQVLASESGDFARAREFCMYIKAHSASTTPSAFKSCFHGIGHGWATIHEGDDVAGKDELAWVNPALDLCDKVGDTDEELTLCRTGVFDSLAIDYYNEGYGFSMRKDDPLWICHREPERFKKSCYMEMTTAILWLGGQDLGRSAAIALEHIERGYLTIAVKKLAENSVRFLQNRTTYAPSVAVCRSLAASYRIPCLTGLAEGYVQFGPPGKEYADGFAFCRSNVLATEEKQPCFESVISYARHLYPAETLAAICAEIAPQYRSGCL